MIVYNAEESTEEAPIDTLQTLQKDLNNLQGWSNK